MKTRKQPKSGIVLLDSENDVKTGSEWTAHTQESFRSLFLDVFFILESRTPHWCGTGRRLSGGSPAEPAGSGWPPDSKLTAA
jgi:hypothetical protein